MLTALQRGIPLVERPFRALAESLGEDESAALACLERVRADGLVRRFGAVFDLRRLGCVSALCAVRVPLEDVERAAAAVTPLPGVTHCYLREPLEPSVAAAAFPNLWFTLAAPSERFEAVRADAVARLGGPEVAVLPALTRFKIDVVFGASVRAREESTDPGAPLSARDRAIVRALEGDTEIRSDYFSPLAAEAGVSIGELLETLRAWERTGRLKRVGLLLAHRRAGWTANGMCCWRAHDVLAAGRALAARDEVTHCYERPEAPNFPYNLFAMVHERSREAAARTFARLEIGCGLANGTMLVSTREFKKTSMVFFR